MLYVACSLQYNPITAQCCHQLSVIEYTPQSVMEKKTKGPILYRSVFNAQNNRSVPALTEHDGLHVLDDDLPGHGGGAVKHDVLDALPVQSLQLPDEEDSVIRRPDLPRRLNRESGGTKCILSVSGNFYILHL